MGAIVMFLALLALSLSRYRTLSTSVDLAHFEHASWLIAHGFEPYLPYRGVHVLGDHVSFMFFPMAWLTRILPRVPLLLSVQSAALAAGMFPLYGICRRAARTAIPPVVPVLAAYALHPAVHNVNLFDFHPEVIAIPALLGAFLFALDRRWLPYGACVAVALASKEDVAFVVLGLGLLVALTGARRQGAATSVAAIAWAVIALRVLQPHFAHGELIHSVLLAQYGEGFGGVVKGMLLHPGQVFTDLGTLLNLKFVTALLAPVLLLPLVRPKYLIPALPVLAFDLLSLREATHMIEHHYTIGIIPFLFIATAFATAELWRLRDRRVVMAAMLIGAIAGNTTWSVAGVRQTPWTLFGRDAVDRARLEAATLIPPTAPVSVSDRVATLVAERADVYRFPWPFIDYNPLGDRTPLADRQAAVRFLFVDTRDPIQWTGYEQAALDALVPNEGFVQVYRKQGIMLFERGGVPIGGGIPVPRRPIPGLRPDETLATPEPSPRATARPGPSPSPRTTTAPRRTPLPTAAPTPAPTPQPTIAPTASPFATPIIPIP